MQIVPFLLFSGPFLQGKTTRPIKPTPTLDAESAHIFLERMITQKESGPIPTPKVDRAIKKLKTQMIEDLLSGRPITIKTF
jgi:hypothetical protein